MSDMLRLTGLNTGYDTESIIQAMMTTYQTKIDKQGQKLQTLKWQQDSYRDIIDKLQTFKSKYFDILNRSSYLLTPTNFSKYNANVTDARGEPIGGLKVSTSFGSAEGEHKLKLEKLATASTAKGASLNPETFTLDLEKAAKGSDYTVENMTRKYNFALDVKVGGTTKKVEFSATASMNADGTIDMDEFRNTALSSFNEGLKGFGQLDANDADDTDWFVQAKLNADGNISFETKGNVTMSVTEHQGMFGLAQAGKSVSIAPESAVTGTNSIAVEVDGKLRNVYFQGVASTYFDSKDEPGNESILREYNALKLNAYRKANKLGAAASVSQEDLDKFNFTSSDAAKARNSTAITKALNTAFSRDDITFSIDGSTMTAKNGKGEAVEFSATATSGGTLGLAKGSVNNKYDGKTKLSDMGMVSNGKDGGYSLTINGTKIELGKNATINSLMDAVNKSDAKVKLTYSSLDNAFTLQSTDFGTSGGITINDGASITKALGLSDENGNLVNYTAGENAIFEIDGVRVTNNDNNYTVDGTTFTFTDEMELNTTYNVGVSRSYDDVKTLVKDFVKDYNQLIDDVYGYTDTTRPKDNKGNYYDPLTDTMKESMSDDEIEKWEEQSKKGLLYHDSTIINMMSQIRSALYNSITTEDGKTFGLFSMGITTVDMNTNRHGKLQIDEDKLDKAFEEHADDIMTLFTDSDKSIFRKVDTILDKAVSTRTGSLGTLIKKAGMSTGATATNNAIYSQMQKVNDRISRLQQMYDSKEDYWWKVFNNLESMMSKLNSQSSYISSYLGMSMNNNNNNK